MYQIWFGNAKLMTWYYQQMSHQKIRRKNMLNIHQSLKQYYIVFKTYLYAYICWVNIFLYFFYFLYAFSKA